MSVQASVNVDHTSSRAFSGSSGYHAESSTRSKGSMQSFDTTQMCTEYSSGFSSPASQLTPTADLAAAIAALSADPKQPAQRQAYADIITRFGTHFVSYVQMGGKRITRMYMTKSSIQSMAKHGTDVARSAAAASSLKVGVDVSFTGYGANVNANVGVSSSSSHKSSSSSSSSSSSAQAFSNSVSDTKIIAIGGLPSPGGWKEWAQSIAARPMPIKYKLTPLVDLFPDAKAPFFAAAMAAYAEKFGLAPPANANGASSHFAWLQQRMDGTTIISGSNIILKSEMQQQRTVYWVSNSMFVAPPAIVTTLSSYFPWATTSPTNTGATWAQAVNTGDTTSIALSTPNKFAIEYRSGGPECGSPLGIPQMSVLATELNDPLLGTLSGHVLRDGTSVMGDTYSSALISPQGALEVEFNTPFDRTPVVLTTSQLYTGPNPLAYEAVANSKLRATAIVTGVSKDKFVALQGNCAGVQTLAPSQGGINFVAIDPIKANSSNLVGGVIDAKGTLQPGSVGVQSVTKTGQTTFHVTLKKTYTQRPVVLVGAVWYGDFRQNVVNTRAGCQVVALSFTGFQVFCGRNGLIATPEMGFGFIALTAPK